MHVIASRTGGLVEIQIRTELQNLWAQVSEKLADRVGRGIRYGLGAARGSDPMLAQLAESHRTSVAGAIALHEESEQKQNLAEQKLESVEADFARIQQRYGSEPDDGMIGLRAQIAEVRALVVRTKQGVRSNRTILLATLEHQMSTVENWRS